MHLYALILQQDPLTYLKAFLGLASLYILYTGYCFLSDPLRDIPGPKWARFTRFWLVRQLMRNDMQKTQIELHQKYGPVVRLAPNQYSLDDLEATRIIYGHGAKYPKSDWYYPFGNPQDGHANVFQERSEKVHGEKRKMVASLYSLSSLLSYEGFVDQANSKYVSKLSEMAKEGRSFSVPDWMQYYAFDVIGAITVGQPFGFLDHGYDFQGIVKEIHGGQIYGMIVGYLGAWLHPYISFYGPMLGFKPPRVQIDKYTNENIEHKRNLVAQGETTEESTGKQDFVEKLFLMMEKGKMDAINLENTVGNNINAGSDTTGISLAAIIYHLCKTPAVLSKLRHEIQTAKDAGKVSTPITFKQAQDLPYLQAVIKEGLRIHPAAGLSLPRVVPAGGATFASHYFPPGTVVGVNPWVIHRNKTAFGDDAAAFRPERWLESKERSSEMERYNFTFGAGARTCIGKNISLLEINKVIPELIMRFDFELEEPEKEAEIRNIFFVLQKYNCRVKEREQVDGY